MSRFDKLAVMAKMTEAPMVPVFYNKDAATACAVSRLRAKSLHTMASNASPSSATASSSACLRPRGDNTPGNCPCKICRRLSSVYT